MTLIIKLSRDEESRRLISNLTQEKEELKKCFNELFSGIKIIVLFSINNKDNLII